MEQSPPIGKTLAQIIDVSKQIETAIWENNGEITPELEQILTINQEDLAHKIDNYAGLINKLESAEDHYKRLASQYETASHKVRDIAKRLQDNIKQAMESLDAKTMSGKLSSFQIRLNPPSVVVDDETKIDRAYFREKIEYQLEKKRLKDDLAMGVYVQGAHLEQKKTLKIGVTKLSLKAIENE